MPVKPRGSLTGRFNEAASPSTPSGPDTPRRPPVPQRVNGDLTGDAMVNYINGLETRMINHMRKNAPLWLNEETRRILRRWSIPGLNHPAPSWATPRDVRDDARDYAAALLRGRLVAKMGQLNDIRVARYLGGYRQVDPLHLIFHNRSTTLDNKIKSKN